MEIFIIIICCCCVICLANRKSIKLFLLLAIVGLCSVYFNWMPISEADLNWHYHFWDDISTMSFFDVISMDPNNIQQVTSIYTVKFITTCPIFSVFVWLLTFTGNKGILPFLISILVYYISIKLVFFVGKQSYLSTKNIKIGLFYILCVTNFFGLGGLRNPIAFAIFAITIYYDLVEKRKFAICLCIYILACLIHSACFLLLAFRLFYMFVRRWNILLVYICVIFLLLSIDLILSILSNIGGLLGMIVENQSVYLTEGSVVVNGYSRAIKLINYIWLIYLFSMYHKFMLNKNLDLLKFCGLILVFTLCNYHNYDVFVRMSYFLLPLSGFFVISIFSNVKHIKTLKFVFYLVSVFTLICLSFTAYYVFD